MTICARCHRTLLRQPVLLGGSAYGPKCATAVAGSKQRRGRITTAPRAADGRQRELFAEATP
ncbi:hypothetical protein D3C87_1049610 [compost metagenome]